MTSIRTLFGSRVGKASRDLVPDPLLTAQRVAAYIKRDPSRITRYVQSGVMPAPDEILDGGQPAWRRSTIRSWWVTRGGLPDTGGMARYHRVWEGQGLSPRLLDDQVLRVENYDVHARIFTGQDGLGPVVVLALVNSYSYLDSRLWQAIGNVVRAESRVDLDLVEPVWLAVQTDFWGDLERLKAKPPTTRFVDISPHLPSGRRHPGDGDGPRWGEQITAGDVARLIGMPLDVFPVEHYSAESIAARRPDTGAWTPTPIVVDEEDIAGRVRVLRTLIDAESNDGADVAFAAAVIAHELAASVELLSEKRRHRQHWLRDRRPDPDNPVQLAILPEPRQLTVTEEAVVQDRRLDAPLVSSRPPADEIEEARARRDERALLYEVHPDAAAHLSALRYRLDDPDLPDEHPLRLALAAAEQVIADALHQADADFARSDRKPAIVEFSADTDEMQSWLSTMAAVDDPASLPRHLQRRRAALKSRATRFEEPWQQRRLWYDVDHDLLAITGIEQHPEIDTFDTKFPAERLHRVVAEWPQAIPGDGLDRITSGARLRAPDARDTYRPVFVSHPGGTLEPLPGGGSHGRAWGLSSTNTLDDAIHRYLTTRPWPSHYSTGAVDDGEALVEWLRELTGTLDGGPLDLDMSAIADRYRQWLS